MAINAEQASLRGECETYTLLNGGNFGPGHLEAARQALKLVGEGGIIVDGQLVLADVHSPLTRGEIFLSRELSEDERASLRSLGIRAVEGALGTSV